MIFLVYSVKTVVIKTVLLTHDVMNSMGFFFSDQQQQQHAQQQQQFFEAGFLCSLFRPHPTRMLESVL